MIVWQPKDPDEAIIQAIDWSDRLGSDYITTASFSLVSGDVTLSDDEHDGAYLSQVKISGGTAGTKAKVLCEVDSADGQTLQQTATFLVRAR